jgi:probable rRNA maturation factor
MIEFSYECDFRLENENQYSHWVNRVMVSEGVRSSTINYIFCEDQYLLGINQKHLNHDTFTDIITFDYSERRVLSGDIFISIERVRENAKIYNKSFQNELLRVMAHGILHLMGFNDKTKEGVLEMRHKEEEKMELFHVERN